MGTANSRRYSIRALLVLIAMCALGLGWYVDRSRLQREFLAYVAAQETVHDYALDVTGTPGVQLAMTLVTKPQQKITQVIRVPYSLKFQAKGAAAWFEYLPEGQSGNNGDTYQITLTRDRAGLQTCRGLIQKDDRKTVYQNGEVHWVLGDL